MLAQNFKTAAELGISAQQKAALEKTLVLLETGRITHVPQNQVRELNLTRWDDPNQYFNMLLSYGEADCGAVRCIRGTAEVVGKVEFPVEKLAPGGGLHDLFYNGMAIISDPSESQAAIALRSYLTTGKAEWPLALSSGQ